MITSDIPTGKGGGEKANYFIIIVYSLSSFIIGYHHRKCGFDSRRLHHLFKIKSKIHKSCHKSHPFINNQQIIYFEIK